MLQDKIDEHQSVISSSLLNFQKIIKPTYDLVFQAIKNKKNIFTCGNGGSASDALHFSGEFVSKFKSINQKEIFKMEYWPLERAKLNSKKRKKFEGNIAIITGGGGKIGLAIAKKFLNENIEVVLLDKNFSIKSSLFLFNSIILLFLSFNLSSSFFNNLGSCIFT